MVTIEALVFCLTSGTHWPLRTSAARSVSHEYGTVNKNHEMVYSDSQHDVSQKISEKLLN